MKRWQPLPLFPLLAAGLTITCTAGQTLDIPNRADGSLVKIPLRLNGSEPVWAVFDTGAPGPGVLLTQPRLAQEQGWVVAGHAGIHGAGSGARSQADIYEGIRVRMGEADLGERRVIALPQDASFALETDGSGFEAVIGGAVLERYVAEIDYAGRRFRLHDPKAFQPPAGSISLPLSFAAGRHIFVDAQIRQEDGALIPVRLVVDTGAGHALSLAHYVDERIQIPQRTLRSYLGRGISGEIQGLTGRLPELHLGDFVLRNLPVSYPEAGQMPNLGKRSGNLGMETLRRFVVFFDYQHKRMILQKGSEFDKPFRFSATGLQVHRKGDFYRVVHVLEGSPAQQQGVLKGDLLLAVDGRPAGDFSMDDLKDLLQEENRQLRLMFRRGDEEREVTLTTRKLI